MDQSGKRKQPSSNGPDGSQAKRAKGGSGSRWKTPQHEAKLESIKSRSLELGDQGVWVTCQRYKEMKGLDEVVAIFNDYGEKLYNIKAAETGDADEGDVDDIESSIKNELEGLKSSSKPKGAVFEPMRMPLDCVLFVRTRPPVDPVGLVREICKDAMGATDKTQWRSRFINKLTPITLTGKATEKGVGEVAKEVLSKHFQFAGDEEANAAHEGEACSYAIRPSLRAHSTLKRDDIIKQVASLIAPRHKVNLTAPDKVILIDIFQTFCGMSVVDGDWDAMKRYNIHELYLSAKKQAALSDEPKDEPDGPA